jgi:hypothetical protein
MSADTATGTATVTATGTATGTTTVTATGTATAPPAPRLPVPVVSFEHLFRLSDDIGLFEHAELTTPRVEHGYCLDDVARGLLVAAREPVPSERLHRLARTYLRFVIDGQTDDGLFHNRRGADGVWADDASLEDCWGRALWALGTAATQTQQPALAEQALTHFGISSSRRSPSLRATAFAALGAAEVLTVRPDHLRAQALLSNAVKLIGQFQAESPWNWPEPRLRYANAVLPETLLAAGAALGDPATVAAGLAMLDWLLDIETAGGHLSVTPAHGWNVGDPRPGFDQQPIEVAALADACARAFILTGDRKWSDGVQRSAAWFLGDNDVRTALFDPASGGGCDGLERFGRNENQGAESTLAAISTFQQAHRIAILDRRGRLSQA